MKWSRFYGVVEHFRCYIFSIIVVIKWIAIPVAIQYTTVKPGLSENQMPWNFHRFLQQIITVYGHAAIHIRGGSRLLWRRGGGGGGGGGGEEVLAYQCSHFSRTERGRGVLTP